MSSDKEQLINIRTLTYQQLVDIRTNPKPSYKIDGQQVSWESYAKSLQNTIDWCNERLLDNEPFEIYSQGG